MFNGRTIDHEEKKKVNIYKYDTVHYAGCHSYSGCHSVSMDFHGAVDMAGSGASGVFRESGFRDSRKKKGAFKNPLVKHFYFLGCSSLICGDRHYDGESYTVLPIPWKTDGVFFYDPSIYGSCHRICNGDTDYVY